MASWTPKDYTQFFLIDEPTHTQREIRAEYSRMRDMLVKRAARLEGIGYKTQADFIRKSMPKLSETKSMYEVSNRLANARAIQTTRSYSIKGIKEIQKLIEDETGEIVPLGEVLGFNDYMKSWRLSAFSSLIVPSSTASEMYGEYQEVGGNFADFYTLYKSM